MIKRIFAMIGSILAAAWMSLAQISITVLYLNANDTQNWIESVDNNDGDDDDEMQVSLTLER